MGSLLEATQNTRFVPYLPQFIRSDLPWHLTNSDKEWLINHNFKTAIDLRTEAEYIKWKSDLEDDDRFTVLHMPLSLKEYNTKTIDDMVKNYQFMLDDKLKSVLDYLCISKENIIYFCYTGKDRTGVVTAMLLRRCGYPDTEIIKDYMKSKTNMEQYIIDFCKRNPEYSLDVPMPNLKFIQAVLDSPVI